MLSRSWLTRGMLGAVALAFVTLCIMALVRYNDRGRELDLLQDRIDILHLTNDSLRYVSDSLMIIHAEELEVITDLINENDQVEAEIRSVFNDSDPDSMKIAVIDFLFNRQRNAADTTK